jgi:hypothetical protein
MYSPDRLDPKSRFALFIANISLVIGLLLWNFRMEIHVNQNLLHGVCGFLLGISIAMNLRWLIRARRHGEKRI